jgi:hypothetical protein
MPAGVKTQILHALVGMAETLLFATNGSEGNDD